MQTPELTTLAQLQRNGARKLKDAGAGTAALDARVLLCHAAVLSHEALVVRAECQADAKLIDAFGALITRRAGGEPVARILGRQEFWSLSFAVGFETLVPRPDSECLVSAALETIADRNAQLRILDLGTGSGCLLLALLSELPNATGLGVDISAGALEVAGGNARELGMGSRAAFRHGSWGQGIEEGFDLVVSNPPYIPSGEIARLKRDVKAFDPRRALDGGADGFECYRQIMQHLPRLMGQGGVAVVETSPDLYADLFDLVTRTGNFAKPEGVKDMAGRWRGLRFGKGNLRG